MFLLRSLILKTYFYYYQSTKVKLVVKFTVVRMLHNPLIWMCFNLNLNLFIVERIPKVFRYLWFNADILQLLLLTYYHMQLTFSSSFGFLFLLNLPFTNTFTNTHTHTVWIYEHTKETDRLLSITKSIWSWKWSPSLT